MMGNMAPFIALGLGIVCVWIFETPWSWAGCLAIALAAAVTTGLAAGTGLLLLAILGGALFAYFRRALAPAVRRTAGRCAAFLLLAFFAHVLPGFKDFVLAQNVVLSPGAYPTALYWNFDKGAAGLLLAGLCVQPIRRSAEWKRVIGTGLAAYAACAAVMAGGGMALGVIGWAPKWTPLIGLYAYSNLFFVAIPEEAFFRGLIQRDLEARLRATARGRRFALIAASAFFGLCHIQGGPGLMLAATIAGLFYGWAFQRTGRIEASILVHFLLNVTHFALFSYPALKR